MDNFSLIESDFVFPQRLTLFEQVSKTLAEMICHGKWAPGEMLPNEIELAHSFNVSQGTMRRALNLLVDKGALIRRQGKGTFVAEMRALMRRTFKSATSSWFPMIRKKMNVFRLQLNFYSSIVLSLL